MVKQRIWSRISTNLALSQAARRAFADWPRIFATAGQLGIGGLLGYVSLQNDLPPWILNVQSILFWPVLITAILIIHHLRKAALEGLQYILNETVAATVKSGNQLEGVLGWKRTGVSMEHRIGPEGQLTTCTKIDLQVTSGRLEQYQALNRSTFGVVEDTECTNLWRSDGKRIRHEHHTRSHPFLYDRDLWTFIPALSEGGCATIEYLQRSSAGTVATSQEVLRKSVKLFKDESGTEWRVNEDHDLVGYTIAVPSDTLIIKTTFCSEYPLDGNPRCFVKPPWHVSVAELKAQKELEDDFEVTPLPNGDIEAKLVVGFPIYGFAYGICWKPRD